MIVAFFVFLPFSVVSFFTNFDSLYFRFDLSLFTYRLLNFVIDVNPHKIQPQRLIWKRLLARFTQAFLCSVIFVFFCIGSQVNYNLRKLAETIGPDAGRFKRLANSVEEFTYRLLDPLKTNSDWCRQFGDYSLDEMLNDAIEFEQKKVGNK